jgi:hypothetical protein
MQEPTRTPDDSDVERTTPEMSQEDIDKQADGEELPDREAMSLVNANLAAPVNAAVALNALSDNSAAIANAQQTDNISQGIGGTPTTGA